MIWGDLKNWEKYYPTLLFFMLGDFLYLYLLSDIYPMWTYNPKGIDEQIGLTNTHVSLSVMLIKYPATVFIFLSKFPEGKKTKQFLYLLLWVAIYAVNEWIDLKLDLLYYDHGWNFYWSILFDAVLFSILRIHYLKPWVAWILSLLFVVFLWNTFDVPNDVFR